VAKTEKIEKAVVKDKFSSKQQNPSKDKFANSKGGNDKYK
jgi:hypothetical protein